MHDLDRVQFETDYEEEAYGLEPEFDYESDGYGELDEVEEMELAAELLEVSSDQELDQFLGNVFSKVRSAAGRFLRSDAGQAITGIVRDAAQRAIQSATGGQGGAALGLELEGLSREDQEFEAARQVVRFARSAVDEAARAADSGDPQAVARAAAQRAAQRYAPGLIAWIRPRGRPRPPVNARGGYGAGGAKLGQLVRAQGAASPLDEVEEMELAAELLEVSSDEELEEFLGNVLSKIGGAAKRIASSSIGRQIIGTARGLAKRALPMIGGAAATAFGAPPVVGTTIGGMVANTFELELEGMDQEEQEFEVARKIVQLTAAAGQNAAAVSGQAPPAQVAKAAVTAAARRYAPGLVRLLGEVESPNGAGGQRRRTGRWVRRGGKVTLYGV